ncbi:MAG TPA: OFA family MFS transporter [Methanoculleus sp.]|nr:OFA family MFS transporter [Methanoculleus sp.]HPZ32986.1 OFA family MFS transporter [Methanoculleus sp.]HQD24330.1 OFA family MFS transporter [Methanoculleus sp.]
MPDTTPAIFGMPAEKGRWGLVALGLIINLCLGSIYAWSVFTAPLAAHFTEVLGRHVTAGEVLLPFSVFLAFFAIAMPLAGKYIERYGPRNVTIVGGILTGFGWLLASTVSSVEALYIVYGVIGGLGVGITYGVPVAVATQWFPDRRGFAVGLTLLGFGFSAFITANIAGALIAAYGVMTTFRIFGIAFIVLLVLSALPLRFPPAGWRPAGWTPPPPGSGSAPACECDRGTMLRTGTFYGLFACYFIGCLAGLTAISIAQPVGTEVAGVSAALATALVGFFAIFNGLGRPVFGSLTDRITPQKTAMLTFALIAAASLLIWLVPGVPSYIVAFAILWGCLGGWLAIAPTATASYFGTCDYPRCYGVVFLAYGAGAIAGPQVAGFIRTASGTYLGVFPLVAALAVVGFVIAWLLMRPPAGVPAPEKEKEEGL